MSFGMLECPYQIDKNARRGRAESQPSSSQEDLYGWRPTEKLLHRTHFLMGERRTNVKSLIRKKNFNSNHKIFREKGHHLHWRNYIMLLKKLKSNIDCLFFLLALCYRQLAIRCWVIILSMRFVSAQKCRAFSQLKQQRGPQNIMKQYGIKKCRFSGFSKWQTVVQKCTYTFGTIEILSYFAKCTNKTVGFGQKLPITVYDT